MTKLFYPAVCLLLLQVGCSSAPQPVAQSLQEAAVIPKPVSLQAAPGSFVINDKTAIFTTGDSPELQRIAALLAGKMKTAFSNDLRPAAAPASLPVNHVVLSLGQDAALGEEGYNLSVSTDGIAITANQPAGIFMGLQTLWQLLPVDFGKSKAPEEGLAIGAGTIRDYPSIAYRSSMLDVSRHFFDVEDVKRYIDFLATYKFNTLHLHLSDDQGWRIEIKSWPNLTAHGGSTEVGGGKGGFYTQEQYKDIVKYGQDRFVTIVPEIDMPGHTNAALASYPELNCNNKAPELYTKTEVGFSSLCVRKDITYKFIDDVVKELAAITPGPYIHLGGDESHATKKDDFIYFINHIKDIPAKYGKRMIGWEEIAQADIDSTIIVQYWANAKHALEAVKKGAKIIMSPATKTYLDMKYDSTTKLGLQWAARIEVDSAYDWSASQRVPGITKENILGVEAPLWSETLTDMDEIEYLLFPRLPGIAEVSWTPDSQRSWDEYKIRLARQGPRMKAMGIDYYESKKVPWNAVDSMQKQNESLN